MVQFGEKINKKIDQKVDLVDLGDLDGLDGLGDLGLGDLDQLFRIGPSGVSIRSAQRMWQIHAPRKVNRGSGFEKSKCLKIGKVTFFLGEKSSENQKSYVLGSDPFDEVYKGVQLSLVGYFAPLRS